MNSYTPAVEWKMRPVRDNKSITSNDGEIQLKALNFLLQYTA
jgi:hypothetical protein